MLARPELRQLTQRISARYHLEPLSPAEVANYIGHRLGVAGVERQLFPAATIRKIYHLSGGIPRVINLLCDRALLGAYVQEKNSVSPKLLARTAKEVFGDTKSRQKKPTDQRSNIWPVMLPWVLLSGVAALAATWLLLNNPTVAVTPQPPAIAEPQPAAIPHAQKTPAGLTWPQDVAITDSLALAHNNLFKLWGYAYPEQKTLPGDYALQNGLRYLTKRGSLGSLRTLNRPAVLKLNNRGQIFYATLSTVTSNSATFICADTVQTISITDLITQWQGEFSLLWQPPAGYQSAVTPGEKGPIVLWVEQQLALLYQRTASNNPKLTLTGLLLDEVKQFQEEQGLNADGIVGPITIIHLNNKLSTSQPQLIMPDEG
jgi:general secretion pathway protein A